MNDILDTTPTTSIDRTIWKKFNDYTYVTPEEVLAAHNNDITAILYAAVMKDDAAEFLNDLADQHHCEATDILRSVSRTLHAALRA
jgi:hypothetical protein